MRYKPKRENYPNGYYGEIDYNTMLERYCTYLENQNKQLRLHSVSQQRELLLDYEKYCDKMNKIYENPRPKILLINAFLSQ